ncbi:hypothetical protein RFI_29669 [Reticulomyxa filosa]|uniref:Uncharacterized protein n=1 Tax=Reticulomyxa filosa TaxID=46433 RepID=X6M2B0_RETFI|nr:hypothetical protein RFI_29669 [Reticulomyxa filosa]|eukprot:ETO07721.1 hypothetical protein RFI_29669 [Reticulomyxa filosa]
MALDKDNEKHRQWSNDLDDKYRGQLWYDRIARPLAHGAYHAVRYTNSRNKAEWARAKDQFGVIFGREDSYLKEYREKQKKKMKTSLSCPIFSNVFSSIQTTPQDDVFFSVINCILREKTRLNAGQNIRHRLPINENNDEIYYQE